VEAQVGARFLVVLPNMRLKLAGAVASNGNGVFVPCGHELSFNGLAPASLSPAA
jgi:hypothetical protein